MGRGERSRGVVMGQIGSTSRLLGQCQRRQETRRVVNSRSLEGRPDTKASTLPIFSRPSISLLARCPSVRPAMHHKATAAPHMNIAFSFPIRPSGRAVRPSDESVSLSNNRSNRKRATCPFWSWDLWEWEGREDGWKEERHCTLCLSSA